jgi:hypothetical protein
LNLDHHWSRGSFEVGPADDECDIMIPWWWMLKHPLTLSSNGKARFKNTNCKRNCIKIAIKKIDIKYDDTIAFDYEQYQKAQCLGYMNPQGIAIRQLFGEQHE